MLRAVFVPAGALAVDTVYTLSVAPGLTDREGAPVAIPDALAGPPDPGPPAR